MAISLIDEFPVLDQTLKELGTNEIPLWNRPPEYERRLIIIDGANVICTTSSGSLSLCGLFSLIRILTKYDFEVLVLLQIKYWLPWITKLGWETLEEFRKLKIIDKVPYNQFDDEYFFKISQQTGGVVLSNDQFRDFQELGRPYLRFVMNFSTLIHQTESVKSHFMTKDGHYVAHSIFHFEATEGKFWSSPTDFHHELCAERNRNKGLLWPNRKIEIMACLARNILKIRYAEISGAKFSQLYNREEWKNRFPTRFYTNSILPDKRTNIPLPDDPFGLSDRVHSKVWKKQKLKVEGPENNPCLYEEESDTDDVNQHGAFIPMDELMKYNMDKIN